jgi:hypothetical protein
VKPSPDLKSPAFLVAFLLLILVAAGMAILPGYMNVYLRKEAVPARRHMREVSKSLASWVQVGHDQQEAEDILKTLGTHNTVTRAYVERNPPPGREPQLVELHIAYYTGMVDTVPHVSDRCMVGGGWQPLTGSRVYPIQLDMSSWRRATSIPKGMEGSDEAATLTEMRLPVDPKLTDLPGAIVYLPYGLIAPSDKDDKENGVVQMRIADFVDPKSQSVSVIGHFFIANNRLTPSANEVRQLAFRLEDDCAYYVKVQISISSAPSRDGRPQRAATAEDLARIATGFVSEVLPEVMLCLPDWVRLEGERREAKARELAGKAGAGN